MDESTPLAQERESHRQVRRNLFRTIQHELYTSQILFTFSVLLTLSKLITTFCILSWTETETDTPLKLWNGVSFALDLFFLTLKAFRYPYVKRARNGEEVEEACGLQVLFIIQASVFTIWQFPGNIWYWRCKTCYDDAPALTGFTFAQLILGYLYMLLPGIILASICACLPAAIIFVMMISGDSQRPASADQLKSLKTEEYDPEKHLGDSTCTICASEYQKSDSIVSMQCDPRHFFHTDCIKRWLQINANCPICRAPYILESE